MLPGAALAQTAGHPARGHRHRARAPAPTVRAPARVARGGRQAAPTPPAAAGARATHRAARLPGRRSDAHHRHRLRPQQGAGDGADADRRGLLARLFAERGRDAACSAFRASYTNDVQGNDSATDLRYRGFSASPVQGTPQGLAVYMQGVRVNEAFGDTVNWDLIPTIADRPCRRLDQQSGLRPQCAGRRDQLPDEGRLHLSGYRIRCLGRLLRPRRRLDSIRRAQRRVGVSTSRRKGSRTTAGATSRRRGSRRFYGDLGWKGTDAEIHLVASAADNYLRRGRADADRAAQQRLPVDLHLAADHQEPGGAARAQRPLFRDRPLDGAEQSLLPQVPPGACRRQCRRGRALQRQRGQSAVQHAVPGRRRLPAAAAGQLPDPQSEQPADQLPSRDRQYLRAHAMGHGRPHLHQRDDDRRLAAGPQRRQGVRSRQLLHDRRQRRPQQDRLPGHQRARLHLS